MRHYWDPTGGADASVVRNAAEALWAQYSRYRFQRIKSRAGGRGHPVSSDRTDRLWRQVPSKRLHRCMAVPNSSGRHQFALGL